MSFSDKILLVFVDQAVVRPKMSVQITNGELLEFVHNRGDLKNK